MARQRSAAERSAIVAAAGMMAEIWLALRAAVRKLGGTDDQIYKLNTPEGKSLIDQIAQIVVGAVVAPIIQVAWQVVLIWIIGACRFVSYVNPGITAEHFPYQAGDLDIKEVIIVPINWTMSTADVLALLNERGLRPARLMELLWWWLTNPGKQSNCLVVALGSVWRGDVPCVGGGGAFRRLGLGTLAADWGARCTFAAVSKSR